MDKTLTQQRTARMSFIAMAAIAIVKVGGYYAGLPDGVTDTICYWIGGLAGGYLVKQGAVDVTDKIKNPQAANTCSPQTPDK
jgi:hypothetical protein